MVDPPRPAHFGYMHQPFDARLELYERAVVHDVDDFALDAQIGRVCFGGLLPRTRLELLEAQGDLLALAVDVEDLDFDFLIDRDALAGMVDAVPTHVGDVQQTVDAAQVDERAEIGDVLDHALARLSHLQFLHQQLFGRRPFVLDQLAAGDDDVAAFLVDLEDDRFDFLVDVLADIGRPADVDLRGGQKDRHADVDQHTALDLPHHAALDPIAFLGRGHDPLPVENAIGLAFRDDYRARVGFDRLEQDVDLVAYVNLAGIFPFMYVDDAFALQPDVEHHVSPDDVDHAALHNGVGLERADAVGHGLLDGVLVEALAEYLRQLGVEIILGDFNVADQNRVNHECVLYYRPERRPDISPMPD